MICEPPSCPSHERTGISLDALGPLVCRKLKHSSVENEGMGIEAFREVTQFAEVEPSTCYDSACEGLLVLML